MPAFRYDPCRGRFSGWIWTLTRHKAIDFRRHLKRNGGGIAAELNLSPEQTRYRAYRLKKRLRRSLARAARA